MAKVNVDIPQSLIDETSKKKIAALEREVRRLKRQVSDLEKLNLDKKKIQNALSTLRYIVSELQLDFGDLYE